MPTIGVEFQTKNIKLYDSESENYVTVSAQIWDTSGSERYRSIVLGHYRAAVGAVLVFDITDKESWQSLSHWLKELRQNCDKDCIIALMANKVDIVKERPELREVSTNEIRQFSLENNLVFIGETSAKDDINIKETFEDLMHNVH